MLRWIFVFWTLWIPAGLQAETGLAAWLLYPTIDAVAARQFLPAMPAALVYSASVQGAGDGRRHAARHTRR